MFFYAALPEKVWFLAWVLIKYVFFFFFGNRVLMNVVNCSYTMTFLLSLHLKYLPCTLIFGPFFSVNYLL